MAQNSKIQWTDHTFNPWRGCTKISDGCKFCYAETLSGRNPKALGVWGPRGDRVIGVDSYWKQPLAWARAAANSDRKARVFCASLADVGEGEDTMPKDSWPKVQAARQRLSDLINKTADYLDWQLLTKRPDNMPLFYHPDILKLCWIGTSCENQATADERIPHLLKCPAAIRFLSLEPLLGTINLDFAVPSSDGFVATSEGPWHVDDGAPSVQWVIVGGESGPGARPCNVEWIRSIVGQCKSADTKCFVKQLGKRPIFMDPVHADQCDMSADPADIAAWMKAGEKEWNLRDSKGGDMSEWPEDLRIRQLPERPPHA